MQYLGENASVTYGSQTAIDDDTRALIAEAQRQQQLEKNPTRTYLDGPSHHQNPLGLQNGGGSDIGLSSDCVMHKKAVGLNYVPYNEFPFPLHEGDEVWPKAEATAWRRGEGTEGVSIDYDRMAEIIASAVVQDVSGLAIQMDKQTVGTIVSPVVFNEIS